MSDLDTKDVGYSMLINSDGEYYTSSLSNLLLYVKPEKYQEMVELDVSSFTKNLKGLDYLNWARALYLLKLHFPTFSVEYVMCEGKPFVEVDPEDLEDPIRGTLVGAYIRCNRTGAKSQTVWLPVMTTKKGSVKPAAIEPNARLINDNMQRVAAKCIAIVTGIGFNLFLRLSDDELDEADDSKPVSDTPKDEGKKLGKRRMRDDDDYGEDEDEEPLKRQGRQDEDDDEDDDEDEDDEEPKAKRVGLRRGLPTRGKR